LNVIFVLVQIAAKLRVLGALLDGKNSADCIKLATNEVLEANCEQVPLFDRHFTAIFAEDRLEEFKHVVKALGLLSYSCHEDLPFFVIRDYFLLYAMRNT